MAVKWRLFWVVWNFLFWVVGIIFFDFVRRVLWPFLFSIFWTAMRALNSRFLKVFRSFIARRSISSRSARSSMLIAGAFAVRRICRSCGARGMYNSGLFLDLSHTMGIIPYQEKSYINIQCAFSWRMCRAILNSWRVKSSKLVPPNCFSMSWRRVVSSSPLIRAA